jgi:uncharacterized protein (TIGR02391 family)
LKWHLLGSSEDIQHAIGRLRTRIEEVEALARDEVSHGDVRVQNVISNIRRTILEIFGGGSREYREHVNHDIWDGPYVSPMSAIAEQRAFRAGLPRTIAMLEGLIANLEDRQRQLEGPSTSAAALDERDLHPRIAEVSRDLYRDRHYSHAVFEACKVLVNLVKKKAGRPEWDGSDLMLKAFSPDKPVLQFNPMKTETEVGEQRGLMFLFAGVVLAIRNPRAHDAIGDSAEEARDYLVAISRLVHRLDGAVLVDGELHLWLDYQGANEDEVECGGAEIWFTTPGGGPQVALKKRYGANQTILLKHRLQGLRCAAVDTALDGWPDLVDFDVRCQLSWTQLQQLGLLPP